MYELIKDYYTDPLDDMLDWEVEIDSFNRDGQEDDLPPFLFEV